MPRGRPTSDPRTVTVSVRLAPRHKQMLQARARREGITLSEALRRELDEALARSRHRGPRAAR
jgi:hypothetical protein